MRRGFAVGLMVSLVVVSGCLSGKGSEKSVPGTDGTMGGASAGDSSRAPGAAAPAGSAAQQRYKAVERTILDGEFQLSLLAASVTFTAPLPANATASLLEWNLTQAVSLGFAVDGMGTCKGLDAIGSVSDGYWLASQVGGEPLIVGTGSYEKRVSCGALKEGILEVTLGLKAGTAEGAVLVKATLLEPVP